MATTRKAFVTLADGQDEMFQVVNDGLQAVDDALAGTTSKSLASADVTLTTVEARSPILVATGTLTTNRNLIVPATTAAYLVYNNTSAAYTVTVKTPSGTGVTVTQGYYRSVYCDGTNVVAIDGLYELTANKGIASGYASLDGSARVPVAQLGSGTPDGTKFLRDDGAFVTPTGLTAAAHAATHAAAGSDPVTLTLVQISDAGTMAAQAASGVAITGGSVTGITDLTVADGGTGASDAATARTNLGAAATSHTHAAADVVSGQLAVARLASGTPDGTKFVRDDGVLAVPTGSAPGAHAASHADGGSDEVSLDASQITSGALPIVRGGTGSSTAAGARTNLGLGTAAVRDAPASGDAASGETVLGSDTRLTDSRSPTYGSQSANTVLAGPTSGVAATPTFRAAVAADIPNLDAAKIASGTLDLARLPTGVKHAAVQFVVDGGGSVITTGVKGDLLFPVAGTITKVTLLADQSGSIVIDLWKDTYANYPPTVADTITASAKPTISSATKSQDATLTGWTTTVTAGDTLRINVDSVTTIQRVTLIVEYDPT